MLGAARELEWSRVPQMALAIRDKYASSATEIQQAIKGLPRDGFLALYKDGGRLFLNVGDWIDGDDLKQWEAALKPLCDDLEVAGEAGHPGDPWVKLAFRYTELPHQVKEAYSNAMRGLGQLTGYLPGGWADSVGGPTPLSGMLGGGLLGAGLGYGAGWLGEQLLPRGWKRGRLRRTLAILGGLGGAMPGGMAMLDNFHKGRSLNSGALMNYPAADDVQRYMRVDEDGNPNPDYDPNMPYVPPDYKLACDAVQVDLPDRIKEAFSRTGFELPQGFQGPSPIIPVDMFNYTVNNDPYVASRLPPPMRAAATGLTETAYQGRGGRGPRLIGPADVAKISAGMGSGYLSGAIVGKALGALMGMPEPTQNRLKQTGMWAGVVANLVPLAFGAR